MCIFVAAARINIFSAAHAGKPLAMLARNWTSARSAGAGAGGGWYKDSEASNGRSRAVISSFAATAPFSCATILVRTLPAPIFYCLGAKVILGFPPIWDFSGHLFNSFPAACDFKQIFYSACLLSLTWNGFVENSSEEEENCSVWCKVKICSPGRKDKPGLDSLCCKVATDHQTGRRRPTEIFKKWDFYGETPMANYSSCIKCFPKFGGIGIFSAFLASAAVSSGEFKRWGS